LGAAAGRSQFNTGGPYLKKKKMMTLIGENSERAETQIITKLGVSYAMSNKINFK
jgi:hypothetical protein